MTFYVGQNKLFDELRFESEFYFSDEFFQTGESVFSHKSLKDEAVWF